MSRDLTAIHRALRAWLADGERITAVTALTTGFSNETYLLEGLDAILRLPPMAGAMVDGHDVIAQACIYRDLGRIEGGPPVPRILAIGEDDAVLGTPFFVMERAAGEPVHDTQLQDWFTDASDAFRAELAGQWIETFAGFARLEPLATLGEPVSPEDDARMWRAFAQQADCPALVGCFDRLLARPAPRSGAPAVVHGDVKLSNFMFSGGALSAVLDWEMALNGEPLADLGYALYFFESEHHRATTQIRQPGMPSRDETIALWEKHSGRSAQGIGWHEIAQLAKVSAIIAEGTNMHLTGRSDDPKLAYFKQNLEYYLGVLTAMLDADEY